MILFESVESEHVAVTDRHHRFRNTGVRGFLNDLREFRHLLLRRFIETGVHEVQNILRGIFGRNRSVVAETPGDGLRNALLKDVPIKVAV